MKKRVICILLVVCMLLSVSPITYAASSAANDDKSPAANAPVALCAGNIIDFTDPESAEKFEVINPDATEIIEGAGLYMVTTKDAFEPCNGQLSGNAAITPKDVVAVPVEGDWTATLAFDVNLSGARNGYYQFFGFYAAEGDDYQNMAGIRGGDATLQNFLRIDGMITADNAEMNSTPGIGRNEIHWFRISKNGDDYICSRSDDGEEFYDIFCYEDTGIEADKLYIDAYTGMTEGYTVMLKSLTLDGTCEHEYSNVVITEPTCTEPGYTTYTCSKCGDYYIMDEVPAIAHDYVGGVCTRCGDDISVPLALNTEADAFASNGEWCYFRFTPEKTEWYQISSAGDYDTYCYLFDEDGNIIADDDDSGPDWNFSIGAELIGGKTYYIGVSMYNYMPGTFQVVCSLQHNYMPEAITEAACEAGGELRYTCEYCGDSYTVIVPAGHDYVGGVCTRCGNDITVPLALNTEADVSASDGEWCYLRLTPEITDWYRISSTGELDTYCYLFDENRNPIAYDDDSGEDLNFFIGMELTGGKTYYIGVGLYDNMSNAFCVSYSLLHGYMVETITEATCEVDGEARYTCEYCGDTYTEIIPAGHDYVGGICTRCGDDASTPITLDTEMDAIVSEDSYCYFRFTPEITDCYQIFSVGDCDTYGYLYDEDHNLIASNDDSDESFNFSICMELVEGKTYYIGARMYGNVSGAFQVMCSLRHSYVPEAITEAVCEAGGELRYTCEYCGDNYTGIIPAGHNFVDGACTRCGAETFVSGSFENGLTWVLRRNDLTISGNGALPDWDDGEAPWAIYAESIASVTIESGVTHIGGWAFYGFSNLEDVTIADSVTSLGNGVFYGCNNLTSLAIPDSVTTIGDYAFYYCNNLTSVNIPDGVTRIGDCTFYRCRSLASLTIPDSVASIGDQAFFDCENLMSLTIPDGVTSIGDYAFDSCFSLTSLAIPDGVTSIGEGTVKSCYNLTSITIPDTVTSIGNRAFYYCHSLTSIAIPDGVTSIGNETFSDCASLTSITIPDGVTSIGDRAFYNCASLESIIIPDGVTSIGNEAFRGCNSLTSVTIPSSVISIGEHVFDSCADLTGIWVDAENPNYCSDSYGVFYNKDQTKLLQCPGNFAGDYTIPDGVTSIEGWAFNECSGLTDITIPDSVWRIEDWAFNGCKSLTNVTIPYSVMSIGEFAFRACENLTDLFVFSDGDINPWSSSLGEYNITTVHAYPGSSAEEHAIEHGYRFVAIDGCAHSYKAVVTAPACTERGYTTYTCTKCGDSYIADEVAALGHDVLVREENFVSPTCTSEGSYDEVSYCTVCNEVVRCMPKVIEKLAHTYTCRVDAAYLASEATATEAATYYYSCTQCGAKDEAHTFSYGEPLEGPETPIVISKSWTWNTANEHPSAILTLLWSDDTTEKIAAEVDITLSTDTELTYSASVTHEGITYTSQKTVRKSYSVQVVNGTIIFGKKDDYSYGEKLIFKADAAPEGQEFAGWYIDDTLVSTSEIYGRSVTGDFTLTAVYTAEELTPQPIYNAKDSGRIYDFDSGKYKTTLSMEWSLPSGYTAMQAGLYRAYSQSEMTPEEVIQFGTKTTAAITSANGVYNLNLTMSKAKKDFDLYYVGYITFVDPDGQKKTVFTSIGCNQPVLFRPDSDMV